MFLWDDASPTADYGWVRGGRRPLLWIPAGDADRAQDAALRVLNLTVAAVGLLIAAPVMVAIAAAIKATSPGPVLYRQLRVGLDRRNSSARDDSESDGGRRTGDLGGRPFVMYKFRTMITDAEADGGPRWADPDDERSTAFGRFLRRHRLDELPQLWNVLKGDMAVVGPRPERPLFVQQLRETVDGYSHRHRVRPGITGWAQVNREPDRSVDDVEVKLRYDFDYLRRRSIWFDSYIMLRTPLVMARREETADVRRSRPRRNRPHDRRRREPTDV
ncbi:MAG: sugar transferase [Gemmatimonadota bacterium]|nr:sugar transferase [Gemmatimonadota bacterium]